MASNGIPQREITLGLDNNTVIGLAKPTILQKTYALLDDSGLSQYNTKFGLYYAGRRLHNSNEIQIMGGFASFSDEGFMGLTYNRSATVTFTVPDKSVDYVQLSIQTKLYNSNHWVNPRVQLYQKYTKLFNSNATCMIDKIGCTMRLDPQLEIESVSYEDAGATRTYTLQVNVRYMMSLTTYGLIPDASPGAGAYLDGGELGGIGTEFTFNTSHYFIKKHSVLIPNSELAILAQTRMIDSESLPPPTKSGPLTRFLSHLRKVVGK